MSSSVLEASRLLKRRWTADEPTFGAWVASDSAHVVELLCAASPDWIVLDGQHGYASLPVVPGLLRAAAISRVPSIVRVPENNGAVIGSMLDLGAVGVIVPMVDDRADAERAASACRYGPAGRRSWGAFRAALAPPAPYTPAVGDETAICLVMVETVKAVANVEEIVAVDGVDGVFVGPLDLAISAGKPPSYTVDDPDVRAQMLHVRDVCRAAGKVVGTFPATAHVHRWVEEGYQFLGLVSDAEVLTRVAGQMLATARKEQA
ncbi:MAG: aldolase [Solirubrobacterales bacterium]|jgi:4-hydroxy-2-oxoheptanedioate aldolase|nr:aldolase [Solirubrobacterales bacterium]